MKRSIDAIEHAGEIMKKVNDAVLLTTKKDGKVNTMTISWGGMAIEWGKPCLLPTCAKVVSPRNSWMLRASSR